MSLEKAIQRLAKAIQSPPNPNIAPDEPEGGGGIRLPPRILKVRCKTAYVNTPGPGVQTYCVCRTKLGNRGCITRITEGPCGSNNTEYQIKIPPENYPECIDPPDGLVG